MMKLKGVHHIAIICGDYAQSKDFYTRILGLEILQEVYRESRDSYKLDLALEGRYIIELFSFPEPPERLSRPEAKGLRHLAFGVGDIEEAARYLKAEGLCVEDIRMDQLTGRRFLFFQDPDGLPLELYEVD
ncbi:hypothetical protein GCM10007049_19500 [Echinicola pacifica]|uniref:VOC domain-containing protein n=1 Tax=Echinicola pacifica TaxID=346377 RepID=A0A918PZ48_9BACT|nr:VOC family protein [Echinicola pacifica]GGZ26868.1 hypothetical protein GCM10007049_19500 [Echinicola pacifica]